MHVADQSSVGVSRVVVLVEVNLANLTCCGYCQILDIGVCLTRT